jgi:hypothetical protein
MASISRLRAIAVLGRLRLAGLPARGLWLFVHLTTLTGVHEPAVRALQLTVAFLRCGRRNESSPRSSCSHAEREKGTQLNTEVCGPPFCSTSTAPGRLPHAHRLRAGIKTTSVVGDSVWDMLAARRTGHRPAVRGYGREELERAGAYRFFEDPADLLKHLDEVGGRR